MFWNKKNSKDRLVIHRTELNSMADILLNGADLDFDRASQLEQALVGSFLFGMISAHGMLHQLSQPDVHALSLIVYGDALHYTSEAAAQGVQECINATSPGYHDTMNAIIHKGIDGHRQYITGDLAGLSENILSVLNHFRGDNG